MAERIGRMWEEGELLVRRGELHEGLLRFVRARALLQAEALLESQAHNTTTKTTKTTTKHKDSPITKILAQIMTKLNESVEKNCAALEGNPLLALKCSKSDITQKDVKKAYRTMILKYHPDKNQDCDTSCIFTAIQSAYERLVNAPPKSSEPEEGNGGSMHSSFFKGKEGESNPRSSSSQRRTQHHAPPPSQQRQKRAAPHPPREEDYYSKGGSSGRKTSHSGDVYGMTSEQIRRALRALGGSGRRGGQQQAKNEKELNSCSREELVRRYLNARARAFSTGCNEAQWQQKLTEMIRRERKRERDAEEQKAKEWAQKQEQARRPTSSTARPRTGNNNKHQEKSAAEADKADQHRQERVARMKKELPLMSITELRRMMNTCCIPLTGCVEKADLLRALCKYYGISYESITDSTTMNSYGQEANSKTEEKEKNNYNMNMTSDTLRKVMKSSGYTGFGGQASPRAEPSFSTPANSSSQSSSSRKSPSSTSSSAVWTRDRLKEMEKKLTGDRLERRAAVAKAKAQQSAGPAVQPNMDVNINRTTVNAKNRSTFISVNGENSTPITELNGGLPLESGINFKFGCHVNTGGGDLAPDSDIESDDDANNMQQHQTQQAHVKDENVKREMDENDEDYVISPRGRFLDADEDSDIDSGSTSSNSKDNSDDDDDDDDDDEIVWRKFIHHPSASESLSKNGKDFRTMKSSVDEDMNVGIPSLDELMRSLGDFDFDFGTIDVNSGTLDPTDNQHGLNISPEDHNLQYPKVTAQHLNPHTPLRQHSTDTDVSAAMFDDPNVSPKDLKAARLQYIKKSTSMASSAADSEVELSIPSVILGVNLLSANSGGDDDDGDDDDDDSGIDEHRPQTPKQARSSRNRQRPEREGEKRRSNTAAASGYNDSYWRNLIMYGKKGHTDALSDDDGDNDSPSSQKTAYQQPVQQHEYPEQQLHSSFFQDKVKERGNGGSEFGSPSATAWR